MQLVEQKLGDFFSQLLVFAMNKIYSSYSILTFKFPLFLVLFFHDPKGSLFARSHGTDAVFVRAKMVIQAKTLFDILNRLIH